MPRVEAAEYRRLRLLPLEEKIRLAEYRICDWWEHWKGQVYVAFSGGKDSTVLLHLVRTLFGEEVPAVFCNTGLEYPEVVEFVRTVPNVTTLHPVKSFARVIEEYGYPVISKEQAWYIQEIRSGLAHGSMGIVNQRLHGRNHNGRKTAFSLSKRWHYLVDAPFKISAACCDWVKKKPMERYAKESGRHGFIGTMAGESILRMNQYLRHGCNAYEMRDPLSRPLSFWLEADIWQYLREHRLPISRVYALGAERTGCMFCMFGAHVEPLPNRFMRMQHTHPRLWHYCIEKLDPGRVLDFLKVPWSMTDEEWMRYQMNDFTPMGGGRGR